MADINLALASNGATPSNAANDGNMLTEIYANGINESTITNEITLVSPSLIHTVTLYAAGASEEMSEYIGHATIIELYYSSSYHTVATGGASYPTSSSTTTATGTWSGVTKIKATVSTSGTAGLDTSAVIIEQEAWGSQGWSHKIDGIFPAKVNGVAKVNIVKINAK